MKIFKKDTLTTIVLITGIIATFTIFLPTMAFPNGSSTIFSGTEIVFGAEFVNFGSWASGNVHFSFLGVVAYLLPLAASIIVIFMKKGYLIAILLFTVSAVLLFLLPDYTKTTVTLLGNETEIDIDWVISYGLIIARSLTVLGVIVSSIMTLKFSNVK